MAVANKKVKVNPKASTKPKYRKKPQKKRIEPISVEARTKKDSAFKPTIVQPSEKYAETMKFLAFKKFFVDAQYGNKVFWNNILEFHVDQKKDIPVLLCEAKYRNAKGDLVSEKKVYRVIRYNEKEIVGMATQNINIWMLNTVDMVELKQDIQGMLLRMPSRKGKEGNKNVSSR